MNTPIELPGSRIHSGESLSEVILFLSLLSFSITAFSFASEPTPKFKAFANLASESGFEIPFSSQPLRLGDFPEMVPSNGLDQRAVKVTDFVQREPRDGNPASQRTEVYLSYDDKNLHVVFLAFDKEPEKIRARMAPREAINADDTVNIMIDTFNDQRRAYVFRANPYGIQWDGTWSEQGEFDDAFDTVWESEGKLMPHGFMVRFSIPFKSLRFPQNDSQVWRVMFNRDILRLDEETYWPAYTSRIQGRLNQASEAHLKRDLSQGRNFLIIPFGTFRSFELLGRDETGNPGFISDDADGDIGLDAKFVIKERFVLDLAANPDFSQVESDQPQITVNERFEVFFPERRPFFLENADIFGTPINLVFTRRIADPSAGIRFTGKSGPLAFGTLLVDDEAPGKQAPVGSSLNGKRARVGIFRASHDVFKQSKVGVLYTGREFGDEANHLGGIDGRFTWNEHWNSTFQLVSSTYRNQQGNRSEGRAVTAALNRSGRKFTTHLHYNDVSEGFLTQLGFLAPMERPGTRNFHSNSTYRWRPEGKRLIAWGPNLFQSAVWSRDGQRLDNIINPSMNFAFTGQTDLDFYIRRVEERLRPQDLPSLTRELDFTYTDFGFEVESAYLQNFAWEIEYNFGEVPNFNPAEGGLPELADRQVGEIEMEFRPISSLRIDQTFLYIRLENQINGSEIFSNQIIRTSLNWQYNRELSLRGILQYNSLKSDTQLTTLQRNRNFNGDVLVTYLVNPWTALYLGYNSNYRNITLIEQAEGNLIRRTDGDLENDAHQFFMKFSYLFR